MFVGIVWSMVVLICGRRVSTEGEMGQVSSRGLGVAGRTSVKVDIRVSKTYQHHQYA